MGKKTIRWLVMLMLIVSVMLTACGEKSEESVIKNLEKKLGDVSGYKAKAEMKMKTGQEEQVYQVNVWFKKDNYYRVALENEHNEEGQVILKNEEGVFVLTPALNKSFKFQTDWPENSSQPYLYQSLVNDVLSDSDAQLTQDDNYYVFSTKTNYQGNNHLPFQEIYFDKKTYLPTLVKVMDKEHDVLIEVTFSNVDINPSFADNDFNKDAILENVLASLPVQGQEEQQGFSIMYPLTTLGAQLEEKKEVPLDDSDRVIMTFKGDKNFTLIQEKAHTMTTSSLNEQKSGDPIYLGSSVAALSENRIEWSRNGVEFHLASEDMTVEELIEVANSIEEVKEK